MPDPIRGKTLRWTYKDGPTAGKRFEHAFSPEGIVRWSMEGAGGSESANYRTAQLTPTVHIVSYLAPSGWTLTTALHTESGGIVSVASNEGQIFLQRGSLEGSRPPARRAASRPRKAATVRAR